jgi:NAD(P)H-dependent FMN reductase
MQRPMRLAVIYGSTREGRICDRVVKWLERELVHFAQFEIDIIDPLAFSLPAQHLPHHPEASRLADRLHRADAFILVTPEYNHSFPAPLKFLIDLFAEPWHGKPVAFACYGGVSRGLRAVEQLRLVFAELHSVTICDAVSFNSPWRCIDSEGRMADPADALRRLSRMMAQLQWWTEALIAARGNRPYAGIAA